MPIGTVTTSDIEQGYWFAGSALFGDVLKDFVSDEKKAEIYKKISLIRVLYNSTAYSDLLNDYPQVKAIVAEGREKELTERKAVPGRQGTGEAILFVEHPETEKLIKLHREWLKELSELLENRLSKGNFKSLSEQNYCYMLKSFIDGLAAGQSFDQSVIEDKQFAFAHNMTAKFRTSGGNFKVENGKFVPIPIYTQDSEVLKRIESTGIVNSTAGGKRISDLTQKHLENGDIARGELLEEYKQQLERLEKHFSLTKEAFDDVVKSSPDLKLFDNVYDEIAGQRGRGYLWAKIDLETRIESMEAGWPVSDINALAQYAGLISTLEGEILSDESLIKSNESSIADELKQEKPDQKDIDRWNKENEKARNRINDNKEALSQMKDAWADVNSSVVDSAKRTERLKQLQKTLNDLLTKELKNAGSGYKVVKNMLDERVNAGPAEHEKALLANNATKMFESLKEVDPALVKSSEAFKTFKEELKKLAEMENDDGECNVREVDYQEQAEKVMEAGAAYLRYKTRQLHKDSSHKRSDLERRRVRMVDSIIGRLNVAYVPGDIHKIHDEAFNPIYNKGFEPDVIFEEVIDKSVKSYDNYIKLHTGRVAANGTRKEMLDDLSKVIAALALKKANSEPFNKKEIDKQAKEIRVLYNLDALSSKKLANALRNPERAESFVKDRQKELSEVKGLFNKNNKGEYKNYKYWWNNMSALYRVMNNPNAPKIKSEAYTKLFEAVEEAAHMPRPNTLGKMNKGLIERKVAQLNFRMMQFANRAVDEKGFQDKDMNHDALHVLYTLKGYTSGANHIIKDIDERIDKKRYDKDPESLKFVSEGFYDINKLYQKRKEQNHGEELRKPDEKKILRNERNYQKNRSAYTYMGSGLDITTAFDKKYTDVMLIDGDLPKEKAEREAEAAKKAAKKANGQKKEENNHEKKEGPKNKKVSKEEPAPKARPHL